MSKDNQPVEQHLKTAKEILESKEGFRGAKHIHHYLVTLDAMEEYAAQQHALTIHVIENRIAELEEKAKMMPWYTRYLYQLYFAKCLLKELKQ